MKYLTIETHDNDHWTYRVTATKPQGITELVAYGAIPVKASGMSQDERNALANQKALILNVDLKADEILIN